MVSPAVVGTGSTNKVSGTAQTKASAKKSGDFKSVMAASLANGATNGNIGKTNIKDNLINVQNTNNISAKNNTSEDKSSVTGSAKNADTSSISDVNSKADNKDVTDTVKEVCEDIKDAIKEEFDVSDEDIKAAMELLGLTALDLLSTAKVAELIEQLTGTDALTLITNEDMMQSFNNIINVVDDANADIADMLGVKTEEVGIVLEQNNIAPVVNSEDTAKQDNVKESDAKNADDNINQTVDNQESLSEVLAKKITTESDGKAKNNMSESNEANNKVTYADVADNMISNITDTFADIITEGISTVKEADIVNQVIDSVKLMASRELTSMEVMLNPEHLGSVHITVTARNGSVGTGVTVTSIKQQRDLYYDNKYWENNSCYGRYEQKLYYMEQIQNYFKDNGSSVKGFSSVFSQMFSDLDTLRSKPSDKTVRNQFISSAQSLCTYFNQMSDNLSKLQDDCNEEIRNNVDKINSISEKISLLNKEINQIETGTGVEASSLRDERANLIDSLSKIVNVSYNETEVQNTNGDNLGGTNFSLYINGEKVVEGKDYRKLICESSKTKNNQTDNDDMYKIYWEDTKMEFSATAGTAGGSLKALFEVRDGDNLENFKGKVTKADSYSLTVENISIDNIKSLNLPDKDGKITVNNISYSYDSWEAQVDAQGNIKSVTFNLSKDKAIADPEKTVAEGYLLNAGSAINARGIPYYMTQLNEFVRNFSEMFNQIESKGQNLNGDTPPTFFEAITNTAKVYDFSESEAYSKLPDGQTATINSSSNTYYRMTAANFSVNKDVMNDVSLFATSTDYVKTDSCDIVDELKKLQSEKTVYRGDKAESFLETIISNVSVDTEKAETYNKLYSNLEQTIANQRTSVSGVDEDEEALNLVKFQYSYNMASKIISVMNQMLDKLINDTGVA